MSRVRTAAVLVSLAAHASFAVALAKHVNEPNFSAFDAGAGSDQFVVEQGVGIDGIVKLGEDLETVRTAEVTPAEALPPPVQETKPVEELQDTITSVSETAVEDNVVKTEDPPPVEVKPQETKQIEAVEPPVQVAIAKDASSGGARTGGDATQLAEYRGKLARLFQECKIPPKKRVFGNAEVRITVDELGNVVSREIAKSSGNPKVDEAALANVDYAVRDCKDEALPRAPEGLTSVQRVVTQPYSFK